MSKEAEIKETVEEYLNLESSLKLDLKAREEAKKDYDQLLIEHPPKNNVYSIHSAAAILSAYDEIKELDKAILKNNERFKELGLKIKDYLYGLKETPLHIRFEFDGLFHRAGDHTFFLDNGEVKIIHQPVSHL